MGLPRRCWPVVLALLLVGTAMGCVISGPFIMSKGLPSDFAGRQADEWHVVSPELIEAHSELTVTDWPDDPATLRIALPYRSGELRRVTCAGQSIDFHELRRGRYELDLPADWPAQEGKTLKALWNLPIDSLDRKGSMYRADLKSLIPSHGYSLKLALGSDCGFGFSRVPSAREKHLYSAIGRFHRSVSHYGSCGTMLVRKQ